MAQSNKSQELIKATNMRSALRLTVSACAMVHFRTINEARKEVTAINACYNCRVSVDRLYRAINEWHHFIWLCRECWIEHEKIDPRDFDDSTDARKSS